MPYRNPKLTSETSSGRRRGFLETPVTNCRSSCTLNFVVSITTSASRRIGAILRRSARMPSATDRPSAQRMRTARLAEPPHQHFVACFDKNQRRRMVGRELAINSGKVFDLLAFARIHQKRSTLDFARALPRKSR